MGSISCLILNLLLIRHSSNIEQVFLSIQNDPSFNLFIISKKLFSSQILIFSNFFLIKFGILLEFIKRCGLPLRAIISLQLTKGLFGKSLPLIFKSQLTFSLALTNK